MHSHLRDMLLTLRNENAAVTLVGLFILDTLRCRGAGRAMLSIEEIAGGTGVHWQTARKAVVRLKERGVIERLYVGGNRNSAVYCRTGRIG